MKPKELFLEVRRTSGLPADDVRRVLTALKTVMADELVAGRPVTLRGFGTFQPNWRRPKVKSHPLTGEKIQVPERLAVTFRPAVRLRDRLRDVAPS